MPDFDYTLERLSLTFTAHDIMIPKTDLVCGSDEDDARELLQKHPDLDVIPIDQNGALVAYLERGANRLKIIRPRDIISDATSILDLVEIFEHRKYMFVLVKDVISGYIHHSDLNNRIVKIPYFVILEAFEKRLLDRLGEQISEESLKDVLDPDQFNALEQRMLRMQKNRTDLYWGNLLQFSQLVQFACHANELQLIKRQIDTLLRVRNDVAHAGRTLIENHSDVKRLVETRKICTRVIQNVI